MTSKTRKTKHALIESQQAKKVLALEQLRYCTALSNLREADAQSIAEAYAKMRDEKDNYIKAYTQLTRLEKADIVQRRQIERLTPPYNAMREVALWSLTEFGREVVSRSVEHYRLEYKRLQSSVAREK